ncbi:MAG: Ig-like domain-containing protein, partial [Nanoarchaeota archaeon]
TATNQSGNWGANVDLARLADDSHTVTVFANDTLNNINQTESITIRVDRTAPVVTIMNASFNTTDTTPLIYFNFTDISPSVNCSMYFDHVQVASNASALNNTNTILTPGIVQADGTYIVDINCTDSLGNVGNASISVTIDTTLPIVNLNSPDNASWDTDGVIAVSYVGVDTYLSSCTLYGNFSGTWLSNVTNSSPTSASADIKMFNLADGHYIWNVECNDTAGNSVFNSSNRTLFVDSTNPVVTLGIPANLTTDSDGTVTFNYTPSDAHLSSCTLYSNFSGTWLANTTNSSPVSGSSDLISVNIADGNYLWNVECNDSANNTAFNESNRTLIIDSAVPTWDEYPANTTLEYDTDSLTIDFNATDTNLDIYFVNDSTNFNITSGDGILINKTGLALGVHYVNVSVNDSANNVVSMTYQVTVTDSLYPTFTVIPANQVINYTQSLGYQITATDRHNVSSYRVNDTTNFQINNTGYLANNTVLLGGLYSVILYINDSTGNQNSSLINVTVNLANVSNVTANTSTDYDLSQIDANLTLYLASNVSTTLIVATHSPNTTGTTAALTALRGIDVEIDNNTAGNLTWAMIKIYYTDAELATLNIGESNLKIYYYNNSAGDWQLEGSQGVDTANNYVWANVTHFSIFAAFGSATTAAVVSSGGGGGGRSVSHVYNVPFTLSPVQVGLKVDDKALFAYLGQNHMIRVRSVRGQTAVFVVTSTEQVVTLDVGQSAELDLDGDKKSDIQLSLSDISSGKAFFYVKSLDRTSSSMTKSQLMMHANNWVNGAITKEELMQYANIWVVS